MTHLDRREERLSEVPAPPALPPGIARAAAAAEAPERDVQAERILVNRYRKARKCANALLAAGAPASQVEELGKSDLGRKLTAQVAQCNTPSPTTWALVVELVREVRP